MNTITVLGAGYVGLTTGTLLAHSGYKVYLVEPNPDRLAAIKAGRSFFFEEGIDTLIASVVKNKQMIPTDSYAESIPESDIVLSCVGTPDNPDGSSNLTYVFKSAEETARYSQPGIIYVQKSTVPVGTGGKIEKLFQDLNKKIHYTSNPEFLREGTAIFDTLFFDRVVIGGAHQPSVQEVIDVYKELETKRDEIAALADIQSADTVGTYIGTTLNSAELIKVTANAFLALKISFANSIAKLADKADADIVEVMDAVGADKRIGRAFLNAGRGYGGGCFPKDVSGLIASGLEYGVDLDIMQAVQSVNVSMPGYIIEKLQAKLGDDLAGKEVAVLGLSFKAGTSDVRRSPGIAIANLLAATGAKVRAYDPQANHEAKPELHSSIELTDSLEQALKNIDAVIIATEWPVFHTLPPVKTSQSKKPLLVDGVNILSSESVKAAGFDYVGIGRR